MKRRQRIAVIGLGMAVAPHAKSLLDLKDRVEVAGCWSRSQARRRSFVDSYGLPVTDRLDDLIEDPSIDAAFLFTPPDARAELVERLAGRGKHILMEKPVERTSRAAERIVSTCDSAGVILGMVFQHRFRPAAEQLRRLLEAGELGEIAAVQVAIPWWRPQSYYDQPGRGTIARDGGGVLITQAIHTLDLMLSLTGPVMDVASVAATTALHKMETEDFVGAGLRFASGAVGALMATTAFGPGFTESITLAGTRGTAVLAGGRLTIHRSDGNISEHGESGASGGGADPMAFPHDWHRSLIIDFLDALEEGRPPRITGRAALDVHYLIDALLESSSSRRAVTPKHS